MDSWYAKQNLYPALAHALTEILQVKPDNPIEYLGHFLKSFQDKQKESGSRLSKSNKSQNLNVKF